MVAFFIDADNLCMSAWVEEALHKLEDAEGRTTLRRAYGSAEKLRGLAEVLRTRHIRPFVNLALSKNTTDVALAIDAMEVSWQTPRPGVFAIGSGDADFVPLVLRLRERGFRVVCLSEEGKMAPEAVQAYDRVILVGDARAARNLPQAAAAEARPAVTPPVTPAVRTAAKKAPAKKAAAKAPAAKKAAAKQPAAKKAKAAATPVAAGNGAAGTVTVAQILQAAPALGAGQSLSLNEVVKLLHDARLLGKNAASTKLFKKFPAEFELLPAKQPNQVRYIPPA